MKRELCKRLDEIVTSFMEDLGFTFRKSKRCYLRRFDEANQILRTDVLAYPSGIYRIATHCGLTFPRFVVACIRHHTYGQRTEKSDFIMVTMNCDELYRSEVRANLQITTDDPHSAIHNLQIGIEQDFLPVLDKYSDLPTLVDNFVRKMKGILDKYRMIEDKMKTD
ncbi:MAG: hypothetical protein JJU29_14625 [Verrucomicrobia bacterium]|nr:hypothetical protein [Verrucomicrobiota bacterium]MCH8513325.1 hypothetical protein [Kiritimatiellia bacterium]